MNVSGSAFLTFLFYFLTQGANGQVKPVALSPAQLNSFIQNKMEASGTVGMGAALIVDAKTVWAKGYGLADKTNNIPFTPNTIMNIASISKTFTGVCMMKLVEERKLSLDEDINAYLPFKIVNPNFPGEKITLRHIATHTSGLADRYPFYDSSYTYGTDAPEALGAFLKNYFIPGGKYYSKENFLDKKPGTYREYSNIAAGLAGYIVEIVAGKKLNEYSREVIFKPLRMTNSGWFLTEINIRNHSKLYDMQTDTLKEIPLYGVPTYPDGGVRTSVAELSHFFIAMLNGGVYKGKRILQKATVDTMQHFYYNAPATPENVDPAKLNSGIFWATKKNATMIGHAGSDPGVKTEMLASLSKDVGVILFTNTKLTDKNLVKYFYSIFDEIYKYGLKLKEQKKAGN